MTKRALDTPPASKTVRYVLRHLSGMAWNRPLPPPPIGRSGNIVFPGLLRSRGATDRGRHLPTCTQPGNRAAAPADSHGPGSVRFQAAHVGRARRRCFATHTVGEESPSCWSVGIDPESTVAAGYVSRRTAGDSRAGAAASRGLPARESE